VQSVREAYHPWVSKSVVVGRALPFKIGSPLNYFQQFFKTDFGTFS